MSRWQARVRRFSQQGFWEDRGSDGSVQRGHLNPGTEYLEFLEKLDPANVYSIDMGVEVCVWYRIQLPDRVPATTSKVPYGWEQVTEGLVEKGDMVMILNGVWPAGDAVGRSVSECNTVLRKVPIPETWELVREEGFIEPNHRVRYQGQWLLVTQNVVHNKLANQFQAVIRRKA